MLSQPGFFYPKIGVLARQCLDRRIPGQEVLRREVEAWQAQRNREEIRVDWRFTTEDARIKLKSLYPGRNGRRTRFDAVLGRRSTLAVGKSPRAKERW